MKKVYPILAFLLLFLPSIAFAQSMLVVTMTDGSSRSFVLAEKPLVKFVNQDMVITSENASATIQRSQVKTFTFQAVPSDIESATSDKDFRIQVLNNHVSVDGATGAITLFTMDGKVVRKSDIDATGRGTLSLIGLPTGTYIVHTSVQTLKIIIK